jgi:crossover junction endodeoxyribonuclease RusA
MRAFAFRQGDKLRATITHSSKKVLPYRHAIAQVAVVRKQETGFATIPRNVGVILRVSFHLKRPKSLAKKQEAHTKRPDVDKLARSCLDAISGILFEDDAQVMCLVATKRYGTPERTEVTVETDELL